MANLLRNLFLSLLILSGISVRGQEADVELFAKDMLKIANGFASPAADGATYLSGAGWFTSAQPLELWEVDLSVQANVLFIPDSKRRKSVANGDFSLLTIMGMEETEIPTAFGGTTDVVFEGEIQGEAFRFNAISGLDTEILAHPFLQASIGLPLVTEVIVRYLPEVGIGDVEFGTYAVGLKHNFNQYFRASEPTDLQFAALVSFSSYDVDYHFNPIVIPHDIPLWSPQSTFENIEVDADLWLLQLITSKSFYGSGWSFFGAVGLTRSSFGYLVGGEGEVLPIVNSELEALSDSELDFKGDIGVTYEVGNFLISSMFSRGKFSNLNLGFHYRL